MWHSLDKNGNIEVYDVLWSNGVETDIPAHMLEGVKQQEHHHNEQSEKTPAAKRVYKKK
tara:strand:- start:251 stop:427 length:177 start_codon:yes stop_codon:yes gene_type:complete